MKTFLYIILFIILGSVFYNLASYNYNLSLMSDENRSSIIGLGAGICGLILWLIMLKYLQLKPNLDQQSKQS